MKEVAHGVHKDHFWGLPAEWLGEFLGDEAKVKALLVRVAGYSAKAFGEYLCVTVLAPWANLGATANRVPGCVCPFDR
jgi:hypothetical protein